jgi:20S proteasome subunit alpha 2
MLYQVDPSGSFWAWKASAIGRNAVNAKTFLEKRLGHSDKIPDNVLMLIHFSRDFVRIRYNDDISLEDAIHTAILTLKEGFEGQPTERTIEIGVVTVPSASELDGVDKSRPKATFRKLTQEEIRDYLSL